MIITCTQLKWTTGSTIIPYIYFFQDQKIPKPKRLQDWYKRMLDKGIIERIVLDYKDIYKQALEDNLQSPAELPYFEGDFWPNVLEENIRELESVRIILQLEVVRPLAKCSYSSNNFYRKITLFDNEIECFDH